MTETNPQTTALQDSTACYENANNPSEEAAMNQDLTPFSNLPSDQESIRAKCFHPSGQFIEFPVEEIEQSIPERFEKIVRQYPERIAIKKLNLSLTYAELNSMADCLARKIVARYGPGQEPIGLLLPKGVPLVVAVFGVLKAGKMYVLLDPWWPAERIKFILDHAEAQLIITSHQFFALAKGLAGKREQIINVDEVDSSVGGACSRSHISPDAIACIHYTSGSTGQPKGVMQSHHNALYKVMRDTNFYHICTYDKLVFPASRGGDMFLGLLNGACVCPVGVKEDGFSGLAECLEQDEITVYTSVTSTFRYFLNSLSQSGRLRHGRQTPCPGTKFPKLRVIRLIGEPLYKNDVDLFKKHFSQDCILVNRLGSNETGSFCQYLIDQSTIITEGVVPVGYPVRGVDVLLVDDEGKEVGINEVGEFAVRSRHLALGYWRNPELSSAAFQPGLQKGERIYRIGDLGRRLVDGCYVHLGRKDFQLKIRGNRVEISEVEAALLDCQNIKEAVVVGKDDSSGDKRLIAYVVFKNPPFQSALEIRRALAEKLPDYMVPTAYVRMDVLPVTGTGKVDRLKLPDPSNQDIQADTEYVEPRDEMERTLCRLWAEVLDIDRVGIDDDFFAIGGHSLLAAKFFARLAEDYGHSLPLGVLSEASTVRLLAERCRTSAESEKISVLVPFAPAGVLPPVFAAPGIFGNAIGFADLSRELGPNQPFYGLQSIGFDGRQSPLDSIDEMAKRYVSEIRTVQRTGPYAVIGVCFGATVAYEMAQQLLDAGEEVAFLGLFDPARRAPYRTNRQSFSLPWAIKQAKAVASVTTGRLQLYREEMRSLDYGQRFEFIREKIRSLGFRIIGKNGFRGVQRELHQVKVYQANRLALRRYQRKPLKGFLRAFEIFESSHPRNFSQSKFKWENLWEGNTIRHRMLGKDSGDMVSGKNAHALAVLLAERLRTAFNQSTGRVLSQTESCVNADQCDKSKSPSDVFAEGKVR
jgi:amino acid adenylation domain-containing protein